MTCHDAGRPLSVLCVDDNNAVADALAIKLRRSGQFVWRGKLADAGALVETVLRDRPSLVILDIDMPGKDPFAALQEMSEQCPDTRAIVFSGHVSPDLVRCAIESGAWGYVSKSDGEESLVDAMQRVANGELVLSREAQQVYHE